MKRVRRFVAIWLGVSLLGLASIFQLNLTPQKPASDAPDVLSELRGLKVKAQYEEWARSQDAAGPGARDGASTLIAWPARPVRAGGWR